MTLERVRKNNTSDNNQKLYAEQVRLLYKNAPLGHIATLINSAVLVFILRNAVSHNVLIAWFVCIVLIVFARFVHLRWFLRSTPSSDISSWGTSFISGAALSGIAWGSAGVFLFSVDSITYQVFLAFVLGGMAIGAAGTYAVVMRAFIAYMVPSLTPIIVRFLFSGDEIHLGMGGMTLLFALLITAIAMRINRMTVESLRLRFENSNLISYLSSEIAERSKAEEELKRHREHLEEIVNDRTEELTAANTVLQQEIKERKRAEKELLRSEMKYRHIFQTVPVSLWEEDFSVVKAAIEELRKQGIQDFRTYLEENPSFLQNASKMTKIMAVNEATLKMYGATCNDEVCSLDLDQVLEPESYSVFKEALIAIAEGKTYFEAETVNRTLQGQRLEVLMTIAIPTETAEFHNLLVGMIDITERKRMEEALKHHAYHDLLTGLPNRALFSEHLSMELTHARRHKKILAVLFLDIDRFKYINDTLGHPAGDDLLKDVARRLKTCIRESDIVARMGGDEFTVLLSDISHEEDAAVIGRKIMETFKEPFVIESNKLHAATSIGISLFPNDGNNEADLLRNADIAMYHAKDRGRNNYQFYNSAMNRRTIERMNLENTLRHALDRGELSVYYQPMVDVLTGRIFCAEALVRWQHPELGLLAPEHFIALAEETGIITAIDKWVLTMACMQGKRWQEAGYHPFCITVNLSYRWFYPSDLVEVISQVLRETGQAPEYLGIEITETTAMQDIEHTIPLLLRLSEMGVRVLIDDFGTGYSSLSYLKKLPTHKLKIDKSFIGGLKEDSDDKSIVSTIIHMAHDLNLRVVAEGVETEEQLSFLRESECDEIQGYLFSRPLPKEKFEKLISHSSY